MENSSASARTSTARRGRRGREASLPVISIGSVKSAGTSTLVLTLASVAAAADISVMVIDAAPDRDLVTWASKAGRPDRIEVVRCDKPVRIESLVREGLDRRTLVLIDAGTHPETLRMAARLADMVLVPVRFSPLSAQAASATDIFISTETRGTGKRQAFVATAIAQIPSRIARAVEAQLDARATERLCVGLAQRAAFEAPFMFGGTIFTLGEKQVPGLVRAREEATALGSELDILMTPGSKLAARIAGTIINDRRLAA